MTTPDRRRPSARRGGAILLTLVTLTACQGASDIAAEDLAARQELVAAKGPAVMPFDLDRTTHLFTPTADGGVQDVVADDLDDRTEVHAARAHLRKESAAFARGDFADPIRIHGPDMPGLAQLAAGADTGEVDVRYAEVTGGGRIPYTTEDPRLIEAIHDWFDAQVADHGAHAEHGADQG